MNLATTTDYINLATGMGMIFVAFFCLALLLTIIYLLSPSK